MFSPLILLALLPCLIGGFVIFDKLVRLEYFSYRKHWEEDGMPHGFFWVPPEARMAGGWLVRFGSSSAKGRKSFAWLLSTPEWMQSDERALRLVFWLRILVLGWNVGLVGAIVAFLLW